MERWINMVELNCPTREQEFNNWYDKIHLPDTLKTPGFVAAKRFVIEEPREGRGKYLTIYEIDTDDIAKTMEIRMAKRAEEYAGGRGSDLWVVIQEPVRYRQIISLTAQK